MSNTILWYTNWNWAPSLIIGMLAIIAGYLLVIGPLRERYQLGPEVPLARACAFLLGVDIIFLALVSPLDTIGDRYLFTAHMLQHLLLSLAAPPLLLIGMPDWFFKPLLRNRMILTIGKALTFPVVASALFNVNLWFWHAPPIYDITLVNENIHILSHILYIATGVIFWWPVMSPLKEDLPPLSLGGKLAYLFFSDMPMVLLGAGLTFTPPLYTRYEYAGRIFGLSAAMDQQLGGLLMWIVGSIFLIVVVSIIFLRWMYKQEKQQHQIDLAQEYEEAEDVLNETV